MKKIIRKLFYWALSEELEDLSAVATAFVIRLVGLFVNDEIVR